MSTHRKNPSEEDEVSNVLERLKRAHSSKDVRELAELYAPDATLYTMAPPLVHAPDPAEAEKWFATWDGGIRLSETELAITIDGSLAVARCLARMEGRNLTQAADVDMWFRRTLVLEKRAGAWRITHQHDSVPFYMDGSLGAAVNLKPPA
jgi:ketosteroid isomerase-like protein